MKYPMGGSLRNKDRTIFFLFTEKFGSKTKTILRNDLLLEVNHFIDSLKIGIIGEPVIGTPDTNAGSPDLGGTLRIAKRCM